MIFKKRTVKPIASPSEVFAKSVQNRLRGGGLTLYEKITLIGTFNQSEGSLQLSLAGVKLLSDTENLPQLDHSPVKPPIVIS